MPLAEKTDVLVVGAGPTGLVLALCLERLGVGVRIIDKAATPGTTSRALVLHARTLEHYRQLGLADEVIERSLRFDTINLWARGQRVGHAELGAIGKGLTPFPYLMIFPQDEHEVLLIERLRAVGIEVERPAELVGCDDRGDHVLARVRRADGSEVEHQVSYLIGCDGARSGVRELADIGFPGGTYERLFYVADVELHGPVANHQLHVALDEADFVGVFPMKGEHAARLIGTVVQEAEGERELGWSDVSQRAMEHMQITVDRVNWFSTYRVHHRVARRFARGRLFLAGDAAHIHSPVGGQGMNTGIGDAVNLSWKLAAVLHGCAGAELLRSYDPERRWFAERLVATTDRAFTFVTRDGPLARRVRVSLVPALLPRLLQREAVRRFMFRTVSQTAVHYRKSELSEGRAGSVRGGDRLPWVAAADGTDNFAPLASLDWQLHVYGRPSAELSSAAERRQVPMHTFAWHDDLRHAGLARDAAYLIRPDGHVALADPDGRAERLERYLDAHGLRHRHASGAARLGDLASR